MKKEIIEKIENNQEVEDLIDIVVQDVEEKQQKMVQEVNIHGIIIQKKQLEILKIMMMIIFLKKHLIQKIQKEEKDKNKEENIEKKVKKMKKKIKKKEKKKKKKKKKKKIKENHMN